MKAKYACTRASPACTDSLPIIRIYLFIINTVIGESGLCGWERITKNCFRLPNSGRFIICLDGTCEYSNSF